MIMRMEMEMATYNTGGSTGKDRSCRRGVEGEEVAGQTNIQDLHMQFRVRPSKCDPIFDIVVLIKT